ncbi:MAG: response regulator [Bryobacteraceae bacterium]|jgi:CheY-like chemotaxis protein
MAGETILIVDDTPINLKLTRILLASEGYQTRTAASAEEALEALNGFHPRLVLVDIQLPGMSGLDLARRLKADERTADIAVVALTALANPDDERQALEAGCDGYITKPIDTRALGSRIREIMDRAGSPSPGSAAPPATPKRGLPPAEMDALRRRFLAEGLSRANSLLADLEGPFRAEEAARAVHQWAGTGGLLGFTTISRMARELENLLAERPVDNAQLRESFATLVGEFTSPSE